MPILEARHTWSNDGIEYLLFLEPYPYGSRSHPSIRDPCIPGGKEQDQYTWCRIIRGCTRAKPRSLASGPSKPPITSNIITSASNDQRAPHAHGVLATIMITWSLRTRVIVINYSCNGEIPAGMAQWADIAIPILQWPNVQARDALFLQNYMIQSFRGDTIYICTYCRDWTLFSMESTFLEIGKLPWLLRTT